MSPIVVKAGGTTVEDAATAPALFAALVGLSRMPGGLIFVHGGGKAVDRHLERLGFETVRKDGIRVTPTEQLDEITAVLAGRFNKAIVGQLNRLGARAVGLCLGDGAAVPTRKATRYSFDAGRVGEVVQSGEDGEGLLPLLVGHGFLPVLCSIGIDDEGQFLNVNADDAAAGVATRVKARGLVLLTDVPGILDGSKQLVARITRDGIERMIGAGEITGGMIPKARAAAEVAASAGSPVTIMAGNNVETLAALGRGELRGTTIGR